MLIRSVATNAVAEVADELASEMIGNGWVAAQRVPAAKKGPAVAAVDDPAEATVVVADPAATPKKRAPRKAAK